jgi:hypothetical protein
MKTSPQQPRPDMTYSGANKPRVKQPLAQSFNPQEEELKMGTAKEFSKIDSENPVFNTVVISGGGLTIGNLSGVLKATAGVVSGNAEINDLDDVNITTPMDDDLLFYDSGDWVNRALTGADLGAIDTDDISEGASNLYFTDERVDDRVAALIQDGTGISWTYDDGSDTLTADIGGLTTSEFADGGVAQWSNDANYLTGIGSESIGDLSDVTITTPMDGHALFYDTGVWVNRAIVEADISDFGTYLTTETDPVFTGSDAFAITATQIGNWDTAFGWGDHSAAGYAVEGGTPTFDSLTVDNGDLEVEGSANGLILESPDTTRWRITVDNAGVISAASI